MYTDALDRDLQQLADTLSTWGFTTTPDVNTRMGVNTLVIYPGQARQLAAAGFTREKLKTELVNRRRVPWDSLDAHVQKEMLRLAEEGFIPLLSVDDCKPGGTVPLHDRNRIRIFVAGPMAGINLSYYSLGNYRWYLRGYDYRLPPFNIKKITGATLTEHGK